jgi:hypothetical protein
MKAFRYLIALVLCLGISGSAFADPIDFKMNVLDPGPDPNAVIIFTLPFAVSFQPCSNFSNLPSGLVADGCFEGYNSTGFNWTNLFITFINNAALGSQTPSCGDLDPGDSVFRTTTCSLSQDNLTYLLKFSDGVIDPSQPFFIAETSPTSPEAFGVGSATVLTATPEPASLLLLATGSGLFGLLLYAERSRTRQAFLRF